MVASLGSISIPDVFIMVGRIETMGVNAIYRYWYAEVVTPFVVSIDILLVVTMTVVGAKEPVKGIISLSFPGQHPPQLPSGCQYLPRFLDVSLFIAEYDQSLHDPRGQHSCLCSSAELFEVQLPQA
jgi:hypothetical protein